MPCESAIFLEKGRILFLALAGGQLQIDKLVFFHKPMQGTYFLSGLSKKRNPQCNLFSTADAVYDFVE